MALLDINVDPNCDLKPWKCDFQFAGEPTLEDTQRSGTSLDCAFIYYDSNAAAFKGHDGAGNFTTLGVNPTGGGTWDAACVVGKKVTSEMGLEVEGSHATSPCMTFDQNGNGGTLVLENAGTGDTLALDDSGTTWAEFGVGGAKQIDISNGGKVDFADSCVLQFGATDDFTIQCDGTDLLIDGFAGDTAIKIGATNQQDLYLYRATATSYVHFDSDDTARKMTFKDVDVVLTDDTFIKLGTGLDVTLEWQTTGTHRLEMLCAADDTLFYIGNGTNSFDLVWFGKDSGDDVTFDASASKIITNDVDIKLQDDDVLEFGTGSDITMAFDGSNLNVEWLAADTGIIQFGYTTNGDIAIYGDTNTDLVYFDTSAELVYLDGFDLQLKDGDFVTFGDATGGDVSLNWSGSAFVFTDVQTAGNLPIHFGADGAGFDAKFFSNTASVVVWWDASADTNNGAWYFGADDYGHDVVFYGATASAFVKWDASADDLIFDGAAGLVMGDNNSITFGDGPDQNVKSDGTDVLWEWNTQDTGALKFGATDAGDIYFYAVTNTQYVHWEAGGDTNNGSWNFGADDVGVDVVFFGGTASAFMKWDQDVDDLIFDGAAGLVMGDGNTITFGDSADVVLTGGAASLTMTGAAADSEFTLGADGANTIDLRIHGDGAGDELFFDTSANKVYLDGVDLRLEDDDILSFGDGDDVQIRWDGTDLDVLAAADDSIVKFGNGTNSFDVWIYGETAADYVKFDAGDTSINFAGAYNLKYQVITKTTDYAVTTSDFGRIFTTRGAAGSVTFTLPAAASNAGAWVEFFNVADQNMVIAGQDEELVVFNDLTADSIAFSTVGEKIGGGFRAICDGTSWIVVPLATETQTVTIVSA